MPGKLYTWGGQLLTGSSSTSNFLSPTLIGTDTNWDYVSISGSHCLAIKNGQLWAWGSNGTGQLGDGTTTTSKTPKLINSDTDWQMIACLGNLTTGGSSFGIKGGKLYSWGSNLNGRTGLGTNVGNTLTPTQIGTDSNWSFIPNGNGFNKAHMLAIKNDGTLWAWGSNGNGRTGLGTSSGETLNPTQVGSSNTWQKVALGTRHCLGINNGYLFTWGQALYGALGNGTTTPDVLSPAQIGTSNSWTFITGDNSQQTNIGTSLAINDGKLYLAGNSNNGHFLNNQANGSSLTFIQIGSQIGWTWGALGFYNATGILNGELYAWGNNSGDGAGSIGNGTTTGTFYNSMIKISNEQNWLQIEKGPYNSIALQAAFILPANTVAPSISGTAKVGQTLTTDDGTWTGTPTPTYQRQWQVSDNGTTGWSDISGATSSTYTITSSEAGKYIRSKITATNDAGSVDAFSSATAQITQNPTNTAVPVITGTAKVGQSLSTDNGTWESFPTATYTYQWQVSDNGTSNWSNISEATNSTYTITSSEASKYIRSRVTATNTEEAVSAVSIATAQITQTPTNTAAPAITGIEKVGETLTMDNGTWESYPSATYTYQWQKNDGSGWSNISGATSASYLLTSNEAGLLVRGKVTATNSEGAVDAFTDPTDNILENPQIDQVIINDLPAKVGDELTASASATAGYPQPSISYQWYREIDEVFTLISGANLATYTPVSADAGLILKVIATATNSEGSDSSEEITEETLWAPANVSIPTITHPNHLEVGETLTADPGEWTGYPDPAEIGFSYQWEVSDNGEDNWIEVIGETTDELYLDESFAEKYVRIKVTSTTTAGTADAYSVTTGYISKDPEIIETPLINGIAEIDEVLTIDPGVWGGFPEPNFSYQWEKSLNGSTNFIHISGATEDQFTLTSNEVSYFIRCSVTGTNEVGSTTAASEVVGPVLQAPFLIDAPEITGNARQLQTLTLDIGEWGGFEDPTLDVSISWEISPDNIGDWETIEGAEDDTYLIPEDDDLFGYYIRALVDVSNSAGSLAEYSNSLGPIDYLWTLPEFIEGPEVDGINRVNSTLEVSFDFDGYPAPTAFIQWQRQEEGDVWENIAGEEGTTYLIQEIDLDYIIRAQVTLINDEGSLVDYSEPTEPVQPELVGPILTDDPEITGSFEVSKQLTAYLGDYGGYPEPELAEDGLIWEYAANSDGPWRPIQEIDQAISWIPDEDYVGYYLRLNITVENVVDVLNVVSDSFGPIVPRLYVQPQVLPVTNARLVAIHSQNGGNIGVEFDSEFTLDENQQRDRLLWHGNSDAYLRFKTAVKYSSGQMDKIKETTVLIPKFIEVDQGSVLTIFYNKKTYTYRVADVTEINQDPAMAPMLKCVLIDPGFNDDPQFES